MEGLTKIHHGIGDLAMPAKKQENKLMEDTETLKTLGKLNVTDQEGREVALSLLWKEQRSAFFFIRHFG